MMESDVIYQRMRGLKSREDLARLMNDVMSVGYGEMDAEIEVEDFEKFGNCKLKSDLYQKINLTTKSGRRKVVYAPQGRLKMLQSTLKFTIGAYRKACCGMGMNNRVIESAKVHVNKNYVFTINVKNVFRSINTKMIRERLMREPYSMTMEVARTIATMSCAEIEYKSISGWKLMYVLPDGAPLSIMMAEMVCDDLDDKLKQLAKKYGAEYSRYYNKLIFSSNEKIYDRECDFLNEMKKIFENRRFVLDVNTAKLSTRNEKQQVNGLVMSERMNVRRAFIRELKSILYYLDTYGIEKSNERFGKKCKTPSEWRRVLRGKLDYMRSVRGENDPVFIKLYKQYELLFKKMEGGNNII